MYKNRNNEQTQYDVILTVNMFAKITVKKISPFDAETSLRFSFRGSNFQKFPEGASPPDSYCTLHTILLSGQKRILV